MAEASGCMRPHSSPSDRATLHLRYPALHRGWIFCAQHPEAAQRECFPGPGTAAAYLCQTQQQKLLSLVLAAASVQREERRQPQVGWQLAELVSKGILGGETA